MERSPYPTPDDIIRSVGCLGASNIDQCLLDTADTEFNKEEGEGPQDIERAFNCLRAILMRHWDNPAPEIQKYVAAALMRRAQIFAHFREFDAARNDFAEVRGRYEHSRDIEVRRSVAAAFYEAGNMEEKLNNTDDAVEWYEAAIDLFGNDDDDMIDIQVADMRIDLAIIYFGREWRDLGSELLDAGIRRWESHGEYWLRRKVANMRMHRALEAAYSAETVQEQESALSLLDEAIAYTDCALGQFLHFIQGACFAEKVKLLYKMDRCDDAIECSEHFRERAIEELRDNPPNSKETVEQLQKHLRETALIAAHSHNFLDQSELALIACDRTGISNGDGEYTSVRDKEFAISALSARTIALSRLHRFPQAKRCIFEIYKIAGPKVDDNWTTAMMISVGRALEIMTEEAQKAGLEFAVITIPADDLPDPS